jgi:hypothetical protein
MMFTEKDFEIESIGELLEMAPIFVFMGLVAPFLIAAYTAGFVMDVTGWLSKGGN